MTAPAPSPYEQAEIDRSGIFEPEERVARAILRAVLGDTDGGLVLDGDLPASEIARLITEVATPAAIAAMPASPAEEALRDALRVHHPIMRSETGPFSGCRCGQVKLGQDVIGHVTDHLRAALAPQAGDGAR